MWKRTICALLCIACPTENYAKTIRQIRQIESDESKVIGVNTALGYSTIIEFQSKPISAVLGDQDAFKLEYVGNAITVKPLVPNARSNLFVFTEYDRFNCTLRTGSPGQVDYIVKVRASRRAELSPQSRESYSRKPINKSTVFGGYLLKVASVVRVKEANDSRATTIIEIELSSRKSTYSFSAAALGVKQKSRFIPIESLYLDALEINPRGGAVHGKIVLLEQDARSPLFVVFAVVTSTSPRKIHRLEVKLDGKGK